MTQAVRTIQDGYLGLKLLLEVNGDRILVPSAIGAALVIGAHFATV
ncbi:hypothetical protein RGUI_0155 [Rhodovulum sp. P5]|nr:hypothetical protein [Rhodovulum sp. P5]ARE38296.1 hypothetical protein RGUI_0155 [Rhodovulum sp. P5]